jgi:hypothetical protein
LRGARRLFVIRLPPFPKSSPAVNIWTELGIEPTRETAAIKRAYAARLRLVHPEDDAEGFQRLRVAYERALAFTAGPPAQFVPAAAEPAPQAAPARAVQEPPSAIGPPDLQQAVGEVIAQLRRAEPGLRETALARVLSSHGWEGLDFRVQLQRTLARALLGQFEELWPLGLACDTHFGWSEALRLGRADPAVAELVARSQARLWRLNLETAGEQTKRQALQFLRGAVDERAFLRFALYPEDLAVMRRLIAELHQDAARLHYETNPAALAWWLDHLRPPQAQPRPAPNASAKPNRSGGGWQWWYTFPLIMGLRLLAGLAPDQNDSTRPPVPPAPSQPAAQSAFMDDWSLMLPYRKGAYVKFRGRTWQAVRDTTGAQPGLSSDWAPN